MGAAVAAPEAVAAAGPAKPQPKCDLRPRRAPGTPPAHPDTPTRKDIPRALPAARAATPPAHSGPRSATFLLRLNPCRNCRLLPAWPQLGSRSCGSADAPPGSAHGPETRGALGQGPALLPTPSCPPTAIKAGLHCNVHSALLWSLLHTQYPEPRGVCRGVPLSPTHTSHRRTPGSCQDSSCLSLATPPCAAEFP